MFERFTDRVRRSLVAAQSEAGQLGGGELGPEHILLGLLHIGEGVAFHVLGDVGITYDSAKRIVQDRPGGTDDDLPLDAEALSSLGIDLDAVRAAIDASFGEGAFDDALARTDEPRDRQHGSFLPRHRGKVTFTEASKAVLARSLHEAIALNHNYIGTEHVLLALLEESEGPAAAVLRSLPPGADLRSLVHARIKKAS